MYVEALKPPSSEIPAELEPTGAIPEAVSNHLLAVSPVEARRSTAHTQTNKDFNSYRQVFKEQPQCHPSTALQVISTHNSNY